MWSTRRSGDGIPKPTGVVKPARFQILISIPGRRLVSSVISVSPVAEPSPGIWKMNPVSSETFVTTTFSFGHRLSHAQQQKKPCSPWRTCPARQASHSCPACSAKSPALQPATQRRDVSTGERDRQARDVNRRGKTDQACPRTCT
eukprot:2169405-Rhodomonas_salina.1